jgi:tetratricopeptide (TPR) repeat protein
MNQIKVRTLLLTIITIAITASVSAQSILANKYLDTAIAYQRQAKNYLTALKYYELAMDNGNLGNYTYYNAAQCACQAGQTEKAIDYYKKGFAVYIDYGNYEMFATDTLIKCFSKTPEWQRYLAIMKPKYDSVTAVTKNYKLSIHDTIFRLNHSLLTDSAGIVAKLKNKSVVETINWIKNYHTFEQTPVKNHGTIYSIKVNDSLTVPFFIYIPDGYDAAKKNKLYVFLHGAVSQRPAFYSSPMLYKDDQTVLKKPILENAIIIYPLAKKGFNWLYNLSAYETILKEISFVKSLYNIDDNRVYIGGHSDGGTGTFWFATHKPGSFASFLGLNYNPRSYFDNTNLGNLRNDPKFYGVSGDDDGTFSITSVTNIRNYGIKNGDNWHGFVLNGNHSLPFEKPELTYFAYDSLFREMRNPFPKKIQWETDNRYRT